MNKDIVTGTVCLLILYIYSSYEKIIDLNGTAKSLNTKIPELSMNLCILGIIIVIILELFGSLFLIYSVYTNRYREYAYNTVLAFIIFNIIVSLVYHYPSSYKQFMNFLKNVSITGGFIILLDVVKQ